MPHHQMRFDLAHGVEQNTDGDQNARAAKETRHGIRNVQFSRKNNRNNGNDSQENRARERDAAHCLVQIIARASARTHAGRINFNSSSLLIFIPATNQLMVDG